MFTLALSALASVATLHGATLHFMVPNDFGAFTIYRAILAISALVALFASALLSARALWQAAAAIPFLCDPFPDAGPEIDSIFETYGLDENEILRRLYLAIGTAMENQPYSMSPR